MNQQSFPHGLGQGIDREHREISLPQVLGLTPGITTFVGAGGKTTAMLLSALQLTAQGARVIVSTSTHILPPEEKQFGPCFTPDQQTAIQNQLSRHRLAVVTGPANEKGKLTSCRQEDWSLLAAQVEYLLVEGDGSRRLPCKVPQQWEPVIAPKTNRVVGVLGLSALGRPLQEVCFNSQLVEERWNTSGKDPLSVQQMAQIATQPWGIQKGADKAEFVLLLNQMDVCSPDQLHKLITEIHRIQPGLRVVQGALQQMKWEEA